MSKTILLVDDDAGERELVLIGLRGGGCPQENVLVAEDGPSALEKLFSASEPPALVLLDLNLPGMHGFEVLERIRADERTRRQPVVILSTSGEDRDRAAAYDLGANGFVRKPDDFVQFTRVIRELERYWLNVNLPPPARVPASRASGPGRRTA